MLGSIYKAKNKTSGKEYIGQTQHTKTRNEKPYRYGISGRWSDHVSSAFRGANTPLAKAIMEFGADDFELTCLEKDLPENKLDEREAHWITTLNTITPHGYNVMLHSRCKHREHSTLAEHYLPTTNKVRITSIKSGGVPKIVYVYLDQINADIIRITFGQGAKSDYATALKEAKDFVARFAEEGLDIVEESIDDPLRKYREKIEEMRFLEVKSLRIAKFNSLVALYIKHKDGTIRMCFGGKTIKQEDAYKTAILIKDSILEIHATATFEDSLSRSATGDCL
jgi:group I intron endonuclease